MTDAERTLRALALFEEALEQSDVTREQWIDDASGGDATLAREVRALLAAGARDVGVLDRPPTPPSAPDLRGAVAEALSSWYEVGREIGRGGMATVFLAHEHKHDRDVVIKVLDPMMAHMCGAERFLREVRIAATLAHPHIVPLIDSGDVDGLLYYVMPWMAGETLRERLRRGTLPPAEGLAILRDMAGALAFAHDAGIVHRDLKPENVLLTAGHAYLLDFGIAKLLHDSTSAVRITSPGFPLGTRRYMAPEQAFAAADVDARADIFAWGVLGCELFVGESDAAREALKSRRDLPAPLVALLTECVSADPAQRPASMSTVVRRLESLDATAAPTRPSRRMSRIVAGVGIVFAAGAAFVLNTDDRVSWRFSSTTDGTLAEPLAATVLVNETGDSSLAVVGRFAGDWITDGLQRMGSVRTVPWSEARLASEHALGTGQPLLATVRDEVHAGTIITGTYYRRNDSLHLQAQLTDARSGRVVANLAPIVAPLDRPEVGVAQLRDRVMGAVAVARDERVGAVPGLTQSPPSFSAYQAFDHGFNRYLAQAYDEALVAFRDAFARDTTFSAALLFGARAAWNTGEFEIADTLIEQTRRRERDLGPYSLSSLRFIEALMHGDGAGARAAIERAAAIAPNSRAGFDLAASLLNAGMARAAYAQVQRMDPDRGEMRGWGSYWTQRIHAEYLLNDHQAELRSAREMERRYPDRRVAQVLEARAFAAAGDLRGLDSALAVWESLPADVYWSQGAALVTASEELMRRGREADGRRYGERAVKWLTNRLVATPNDRSHRYFLGQVLYSLGRFNEAHVYFESLAKEFPDRVRYRGLVALTSARKGDRAAAERWLNGSAPRDTGEHLLYRARYAAITGDKERAISVLTTAIDRGINGFPWVPNAAYRDLRDVIRDPRGSALMSGR